MYGQTKNSLCAWSLVTGWRLHCHRRMCVPRKLAWRTGFVHQGQRLIEGRYRPRCHNLTVGKALYDVTPNREMLRRRVRPDLSIPLSILHVIPVCVVINQLLHYWVCLPCIAMATTLVLLFIAVNVPENWPWPEALLLSVALCLLPVGWNGIDPCSPVHCPVFTYLSDSSSSSLHLLLHTSICRLSQCGFVQVHAYLDTHVPHHLVNASIGCASASLGITWKALVLFLSGQNIGCN